MIAKNPKKGWSVKAILMVLFFLFITGVGLLSYAANQELQLKNKIYPHVYLDGNHIGNLTKQEAYQLYKNIDSKAKSIEIVVTYKNQSIATLSGSLLDIHSDAREIIDRAYLIGRTPSTGARIYQKLSTIFNLTRFPFISKIQYDRSKIEELTGNWEDIYNKPAKNALFTFENGRVSSFRQEERGLKIQSDKLLADIQKTIEDIKHDPVKKKIITLEDQVVEPETTLAEANEYGIEELIAEGMSNYTHSIPERVHNLTLASTKFNGVLIPQGKEFSFNETVGDISASTGYKPAYVIKNGRTVLGDGGGICQVSTTLFRAALNAGLPILERWAHAYRVSYYENDSKPGLDATVYSPTNDLKIKNNTNASILIQTEIDSNNNLLYFRLYGKKDGRKIEISTPTLTGFAPAPEPLYQDDPTLKKGVVKQVDFAASGAKASFHYKVTGDNPDVNFEKTFYSSYRPWQAVYLVGQAD